MVDQQLFRLGPAPGVVVAVVQARQAQELVDSCVWVVFWDRLADRLLRRRARVALRELDVRLQLRPARETERSRDDQLGIRALECVELRRARLRLRKAGMELAHDLGGAGVAGADRALERLGAVPQLLDVGVAGKTAGWHCGLLSHWPGVRNLGPERRRGRLREASPAQVGFALSADRWRPARSCRSYPSVGRVGCLTAAPGEGQGGVAGAGRACRRSEPCGSMHNTTFELESRGRDALRVPQMHSSARPPRRG